MAYIRQYKGKWRAEVQKHGFRATHTADTKREVQAWALAKEVELGALKAAGGRTFGAAVAHYLATVSKEKRNPDWERRRLDAMMAHFGEETALASITSDTIGRWRDARLKGGVNARPVSGSTVQREANLLRHLFTLATDEWRWIERNPFKGVRLPKENPPRRSVWKWQEVRRVVRWLQAGGDKSKEMAWAFHASLRTGMRLSEILSASLTGTVATLPRSKTSAVPVKIPLTRHGVRALKAKPMITIGPNEASTLFSRACKAAMVNGLTFHDARATALTLLARKVDVMTLARISQHRDISLLARVYYRESAEQISARI